MEQWSKEIDRCKKKINKYNQKILKYKKKIEVLEETKNYASTTENKRKAKPTLKVFNKYYKLMSDIPAWAAILTLKEEYQDALSQFKGHTLYYLYHIRYIDKYHDILLKEIKKDEKKSKEKLEEIKNKGFSIDNLVKRIDSCESVPVHFDSFKKSEDRRLKKMLCLLTGQDDVFALLRDNSRTFEFNRLDFSFFIFLLDTYDSFNAEYLRKGNYERITTGYLIKCRKGIELLLKYHKSDINIEEINNRFDTTFKMRDMYSPERLLQRMELLKEYVNTNKLLFKNSDETENIFIKANTLLSNIIYNIDKIQ